MTKLVLQLFCLLHFCHLASCWHVHIARLFVCDFACSFAFLHWICHCLLALFFAIVLFIAWLLFLCQIAHICIFCFSAGFCISNLLVLGGFLSLYVHFFCVLNLPYVYDHADLIALHCYCCCYCFFGSFRVFAFFAWKMQCFAWFVLAYFDSSQLLFRGYVRYNFSICTQHPQTPQLCHHFPLHDPPWSPRSSLMTLCIFWALLFIVKHVIQSHLGLFPPRFPVPPRPRTLLHPFEPIRTHPETFVLFFFYFFAKHDVRGNFPGHRAQILPCTTNFLFVRLVFVLPIPPAPQSTHANPSAPIYIHLYPFAPQIPMYICIIYINLNEK